jgi:hypothetical protein
MADELELIVTPAPEVVIQVTTSVPPVVQLTTTAQPQVVTQYAIGPQGPATALSGAPDVNATARIDKSLLYYDAASQKFKADATVTTTTLTDGGAY